MEEPKRPDPQLLLKQIQQEESLKKKKKRGRLCIFLGYAAGVGKTYAMLGAAHDALKNGVDVVAGYIEPHARPETTAMIEGLEVLPPLLVAYKGINLREFDLDAALKRKPQLILVDELAHTNAQGLRHTKRYEDVEELLDAGINVYTTVNIQHLESLNDIVGSITGIHVRERVPDTVFDSADQVKIVDIEPENLIERLQEGKIYKTAQAERAASNFFVREKLIALRELALRRTADRINRQAIQENQYKQKPGGYHTGEHVLTCISPSPTCAKVIRSASRLAYAFHADFTALYVETPALQNSDRKTKAMAEDNAHLAEALGAKIATVFGEDVAYQIAEYAKVSNVSKIVLGRTNHRMLFGARKGTLTDQISNFIPDIDIYIIPDTSREHKPWSKPRNPEEFRHAEQVNPLWEILKAAALLAGATLLCRFMEMAGLTNADTIIVYLFAILLLSMWCRSRWTPMAAAPISVLLFNFFFVQPLYSLNIYAPSYYSTFVFMFIFAMIISTIITSQRRHAKESAKLAYRTELLLENSHRMRRVETVNDLLTELSEQVLKLLKLSVIFYTRRNDRLVGPWLFPRKGMTKNALRDIIDDQERTVAQWVSENGKRAGCCTHTLPGAKAIYLPIKSDDGVFAVMGIYLEEKREIPPFEYGLLTAMLNEAALVFDRLYSIADLRSSSESDGSAAVPEKDAAPEDSGAKP